MENQVERRELLAIALSLIIITYLHYSTAPGLSQLHAVYRYCYFLPIVFAALRYGFWGGLITGLAVSLVFIPHILFRWSDHTIDAFNDLLVVAIFFAVATVTGITSDRMRQMQRRYRRMAEQLVDSLCRLEIQSEELRRAEQLSSLGALAGGLAHEIRNPVGIIRATAQLIEAEYGPEMAEGSTIIQQETDRIEQLIRDLIDYAGGNAPQRTMVNINALFVQVSERIRPLTDTLGIDLRTDIPPNMSPLFADPAQIEQVLMNLCMNAIQALDGPGMITVMARTIDDAQAVEIRVIDTGPGIAPNEQIRIFHPFYSSKETGTGLGLSVVQRIVADHGGQVRVESEVGRGAAVILHLPLAEGAEIEMERR